MRGIVVDLQDADLPVLVVPGGYVPFFPYPRCEHVHETPDEAAKCVFDAERFLERPKEDACVQKGNPSASSTS